MHLVARYHGYMLGGVDAVTLPGIGATWGQYFENTLKIQENQFCLVSIFFFSVFQPLIFLKLLCAFGS